MKGSITSIKYQIDEAIMKIGGLEVAISQSMSA